MKLTLKTLGLLVAAIGVAVFLYGGSGSHTRSEANSIRTIGGVVFVIGVLGTGIALYKDEGRK